MCVCISHLTLSNYRTIRNSYDNMRPYLMLYGAKGTKTE